MLFSNFAWHGGCSYSRVARKNNSNKVVRPAAQVAAMNLSTVVNQYSALRLMARLPKPVPQRRRIAVLMMSGAPEPVEIRHLSPKVDNAG